jgi:hypothetical protein
VPRIIDYAAVRETMLSEGFVSLYHNSGAFGFGKGVETASVGWVGPADPTIREAARPLVRHVPPPFERNLAELAAVVWQQHLLGAVWVLPKSHWAYELDFGSREWMPGLLRLVGVDSEALMTRNDGSAIEFGTAERDPFVRLVEGLLLRMMGSDFALAFPGRSATCTVHHHKQLWWTTTDLKVVDALDRLVPATPVS